jgi:hypothetical protein
MQPTAQAVGQKVSRTNQPRRGERSEPNPYPHHTPPARHPPNPQRPKPNLGQCQQARYPLGVSNCNAIWMKPAPKERKNAAHGASRGSTCQTNQPAPEGRKKRAQSPSAPPTASRHPPNPPPPQLQIRQVPGSLAFAGRLTQGYPHPGDMQKKAVILRSAALCGPKALCTRRQ